MATKLTKREVDRLEPRGTRYDVYDTEIPRFALRVAPDGTKTFSLLYRAGSGRSAPTKRLTIGRYGSALTVEQARQIARDALATVAKGGDPAAARNEAKAAPTVAALGKDYLDDVGARRKSTTAKEYARLWEKHVVPAIGSRRVVDVTTADVARLHRRMRTTPYLANRVLALLGSFFAYAELHAVLPEHSNPAHKLEAFTERERERFLTAEEVARLGEALTRAEREGLPAPEPLRKHGISRKRRAALAERKRGPYKKRVGVAPKLQTANPYAVAAIRFLLLSGWRKSEALTLKWSYIDLARGDATLPDTKTKKSHRWIGAPARLLLDELPRIDKCEYVFPGADGKKPLATLTRLWTIVRAAAQLDDVRLHDLRHSFASVNASSGGSLLMIGKLLGHKHAATTSRYAHLLDDPVRAAADQTAETLATWMVAASPKLAK